MIKAPPSPIMPPKALPRPRQNQSFWWVWVLVALLIVAGAFYAYVHFSQSTAPTSTRADAGRPVPVITAVATTGDLPIYLDGLGTVTSLNTVTIRTRVDGQIEKVAFQEGQLVHKDDLLVQLDPRPFEVQLAQAQGQLAKDQAAYDVARKNVDRDQSAKDAISAQQLDTDTSSMEQAQGSIKVDEGEIASAQLQLVYCKVTSPLTGRIGLRLVDEGNIVHATDANGLAVITQLQPISVIFSLSESDIRGVLKKILSGTVLQVEAYDADRTTKLATGSLSATDSQIDPTSGTLRFKATFPNLNNALFPNQFVNARLMVNQLKNVVIVPNEAVQISPDSAYAYVVKPDNTVEMRNITTGATEGDQTAITQGLSAGDVVVIDGVDKLQDKSKVTPRSSATTQPTTRPGAGKRSHAQRSTDAGSN